MLRSAFFEERVFTFSQNCYPFHPMYLRALIEMGLTKQQIFDVALESLKKAIDKSSYNSFLVMPDEINLDNPIIKAKMIERFGLRQDGEKSSSLGWLIIKNKYLNSESPIIKRWNEKTNIPTELLISLIKNTILLGFRLTPIYKDDIRFNTLEPNISHRQLEIAISSAELYLGLPWRIKSDSSIYFEKYSDYIFEMEMCGYKSSIELKDINYSSL